MQNNNAPKWKGDTKGDLEFIDMFNKFAGDRRMSSTYKPVFLKSLLDLRHYKEGESNSRLVGSEWVRLEENQVVVNLNFIATRFLKYYWDMEYSFKFRQSNENVNILKIIHDMGERKDKKPLTKRQIASNTKSELRQRVISESLRPEVMVHIKKKMKNLFQAEKYSMYIKFDRNILGFLERHHDTVLSIINHKLVTGLEKYNKMAPRIATKVSYDKTGRPPVPNSIKSLVSWYQKDNLCFYCKNPLIKIHFDHVIPYNFVGSHDVYNMVASCQQCNCVKHDRLPNDHCFCRVVDRNNELENILNLWLKDPSLFDSVIDHNNEAGSITRCGVLKAGAVQEPERLKALKMMEEYAEDQYRILYENCATSYAKDQKKWPDPSDRKQCP